jgi:hypothetical protein
MKEKCWVCVGLSKKQICFLDDLSKKAKFSGGRKLRRTAIVRALLTTAKRLDIDVARVRSEDELKERIVASFGQHR